MLTKEQFRAQFEDVPLEMDEETLTNRLVFTGQVIHGYPIFRLLERLVLVDEKDGKYYLTRRQRGG